MIDLARLFSYLYLYRYFSKTVYHLLFFPYIVCYRVLL